MRPKNSVCFVHKDIGEINGGGISVSYGYLIDGFVREGWNVYVITQRNLEKEGVHTINLPEEKDPQSHAINVRNAISKIENEISIIEGPNYKYELLDYLRRRKKSGPRVIVRSNPSCVTLLFGNEYLKGEREQSLLADYNLAVSEFSKHDVEKYYGINVDKVIYEGIDIKCFLSEKRNNDIIKSGRVSENGLELELEGTSVTKIISLGGANIFWCGKPTYMKGYDYLANLIDKSEDNTNFLLNTTPITRGLNWHAKPSNRYKFIWGLNRDDQIKIWKACNMTLITSRVEGFSYVNSESLVLGLPVLANEECIVLKELFFDKYIDFFSPVNPEDFNQKVQRLKGQHIRLKLDELAFLDSGRLVRETVEFYRNILINQK